MLPKYKQFKDDLAQLKAKILAAREEFSSSISGGMRGSKYQSVYERTASAFENIDGYFRTLEDPASADNAREAAWRNLCTDLSAPHLSLPSPGDNRKADEEELNANLGDNDFRRLWRTAKKMSELSFETHFMESQSRIEGVENELEDYDAEKRSYLTALYSFREKLNYKSAYDMYEKVNTYRDAYTENEKKYNGLKESGEVERAETEYRNIKIDNILRLSLLDRDIVGTEQKVEELSTTLESIDDQIRDTESRSEEYLAALRAKTEKLNEKYRELNLLQEEEGDITARSVQYQQTIDRFGQNVKEYYALIAEKADMTVSGKMSKTEKITAEKTKEYALLLQKEEKLNNLKDRFDEYLSEHGLKGMSPEKFEEMLKDGEAFRRSLPPSVLKSYQESNFRPVLDAIELAEKFREFKDEFAEIYGVENDGVLSDIENNVRTPGEFLRLWNKAYRNTGAARDGIRSFAEKDPSMKDLRYEVMSLQNAYDHIPLLKTNIQEVEELDANCLKEKEKLFNRRYALDEEVKKLSTEAEEESYDAVMEKLQKRRESVLAEKMEAAEQSAYLMESRKEMKDRELDAFYRKEKLEKELEGYLTASQKNKALYEKTKEDAEKFDAFYAKHCRLKKQNDNLREKVEMTRQSVFGRSILNDFKMDVSARLNNFRHTAECGKKKDHVNHEEFERMKNAVEAFCGADTGLGPSLSPSTYKYHLDRIRTAAQEYLDAKNKEIRPFPSAMRKYRLDYAKRLVTFAENASQRMGQADAMVKSVNAHLASSGIGEKPMTDEKYDVFNIVNEGVELKEQMMKEKQAANQKQNAASKNLQSGMKQPSLD